MRLTPKTLILLLSASVIAGCATKSQVRKIINEDPSIVFAAIEKDPETFMKTVQKASTDVRQLAEQKRLDEEFKNPKTPIIDSSRAIRGKSDAKITIVEYSDFECPYCSNAFETVQELRKKYGEELRFVYKHLPLSFHPLAMPGAEYFEAIALQDPEKAYRFHDEIFSKYERLKKEKEKFYESVAESLGLDMNRLKKDRKSDVVKKRIEADMKEAKSFGINGTPGFLINGITLSGNRPIESFDTIIERCKTGVCPVPEKEKK